MSRKRYNKRSIENNFYTSFICKKYKHKYSSKIAKNRNVNIDTINCKYCRGRVPSLPEILKQLNTNVVGVDGSVHPQCIEEITQKRRGRACSAQINSNRKTCKTTNLP